MKLIKKLTLIILIIATPVFAGYYYSEDLVYYDETSGFYYIGIRPKVTTGIFSKSKGLSGHVSNYLIYNTKIHSKRFVFPENSKRHISLLIFENSYDAKNRRIIFNVSGFDSSAHQNILNNINIDERIVYDYLLLLIGNDNSKSHAAKQEIWMCRKDGKSLTKLRDLGENETWRINVKTGKLIIVKQNYFQTEVIEFDLWK